MLQKYQLDNLHAFISEHCAVFLKKLHPQATAIDINESWFNFYQPNDFQEVHNHVHPSKPSFLSGCFYINAPQKSGDLKIYHPNFNTAIPTSNGLETFEASYPPIKNQILLFRSHVAHSVMQNKSKEPRISLAFNIGVL